MIHTDHARPWLELLLIAALILVNGSLAGAEIALGSLRESAWARALGPLGGGP